MQVSLGASQLFLGYAKKAVLLDTKALATFKARLGHLDPEALRVREQSRRGLRLSGRFE